MTDEIKLENLKRRFRAEILNAEDRYNAELESIQENFEIHYRDMFGKECDINLLK